MSFFEPTQEAEQGETVDPLSAPWEPRTFTVGERVRVRERLECKVCNVPGRPRPAVDDRIAHILSIRRNLDHPYFVAFEGDFDFPDGSSGPLWGYYAALEIEPLD